MEKLNSFLIVFVCFTFINCTINGLKNDYGKLSEGQKSLISHLKSFDQLENERIYILTSDQLKTELKNHPKAIVYVFTNGCTTKYCLPMNVYKSYAQTNGYQLFLVMNGYSKLQETLDQQAEVSYFSIDNEHYGISNRTKYSSYFENELMNLPKETKHKEYLGNLFFFENGEFINVYKELPENQ